MEIAQWLLVRYDADEKLARNCWGDDQAGWWHCAGDVVVADDDGAEVCEAVMSDEAVHIARWDPAAVVADLNVKRAILALHRTTVSKGYRVTDGWFTPEPYCECQIEDGMIFDHEPCETKQLLALPYAKCEGYREEWRPQG